MVEAGFAFFVVVVLGAMMTVKSDVFLTTGNLQNILLQTSFLACAAFGMTLVIIAAELDLSQGSVMALIGVVAAETMVRNNSIVLGLLAGAGVGIAAGLFNGLITAVLKVPSFITTLGLLIMARGLAREITAGNTVGNLPGGWKAWWSQEFLGLRMPIWVALGLGVAYHVVLRYSRFGLRIYAVGATPKQPAEPASTSPGYGSPSSCWGASPSPSRVHPAGASQRRPAQCRGAHRAGRGGRRRTRRHQPVRRTGVDSPHPGRRPADRGDPQQPQPAQRVLQHARRVAGRRFPYWP